MTTISFTRGKQHHYTIDRNGIVNKGKCRRKNIVIQLEENYDLSPPTKVFWDSLMLLLNRLFETHEVGWEDVLVGGAGKNLKLLLLNHIQRA
jgi:alpha-tubulin suppressor-like RCC1 family protein